MWFYYKTFLNVAVKSRMHLRKKKLDCEDQSVITIEQAKPTKMSGFPRSPGKKLSKLPSYKQKNLDNLCQT